MSVRFIGLRRAAGLFALVFALTTAAAVRGQATPASPAAPAKNAPSAPRPVAEPVAEIVAQLVVAGDVSNPLSLSADDLRQLPRTTVTVTNEHQGDSKEVYEGVLLSVLLKQAGAPQLRGPTMAAYALAEGSDGYRVSFSLAELDPGFQDSQVLVADTMNGQPLGDKVGPLRLVVPQDKRPARWVRMLRSIKVMAPTPK
jgi:DMSO/TMAO reductase YedYZ molybdopterin-dependent catalytic subunit